MEDSYTLKEILLGLRSEQIKAVDELQSLKSGLWENGLGDNLFFSVKKEDDAIICFYRFKNKYLKWDSISFNFLKNSDGNFTNFYFPVQIKDQLKFNQICENILASEFVNNSNLEINTNYGILKIHPTCMHFFSNDLNLLKINCFSYFPKEDLVFLQTLKRNKKEILDILFNLKISKEKFNYYLQNIIDSSEETKKDIIIPNENFFEKNMSFYLNQERENYILVKKKK